jgi:GTP diphosphokinase / guanosine-3',5'-bis(diphosphate) 3'-diphosphatase
MRTEFAKLLKQLRKSHPNADEALVRKAYRFANEVHQGVVRASGDPYISHCIATARILAQSNLDSVTVAAGLLHDVVEDSSVTHDELESKFSPEIACLVEGVSKIKSMKWNPKTTQQEKQAENLRKMLVATAEDVRVILIKLADRLHNMRTIEFLDEERRTRISQETLDIYAPLAHRLGIARWKWELEDHAFHQLHPEAYRDMAKQVSMKRREREAWLSTTADFLTERLAEAEVTARVIGRPKHLYSIYQKMLVQGKDFDQVLDILALRIITQTVSDCYNALGVVHEKWHPVPGRFKDYIGMPKMNMYQSLHTTVMLGTGRSLEVQIRTEDMDRTAREGIAAHWTYKERSKDKKLDNQLGWLRQMYEWMQESHAPDELLDSFRRDVSTSDIYVFTPKGEVMEFPEGATPLDFAYHVHSEVGNHCIGARVGGRIVPLRYNLQTGDVVEILTSKNQAPHLDWLDIVVTGRARTRIRQRLRETGELEPQEVKTESAPPARPQPQREPVRQVRLVDDATRQKLIRIDGAKGIAVNFAKCCNPMPGQPVLGYATKTPGITLHRAECKTFARTKRDPSRTLQASWDGEGNFEVGMRIATGQRPNMLADITNAIRPMNVSITRAQFLPGTNGDSLFEFVFEAPDQDCVDRVAATIRNVSGVSGVDVFSPGQVANVKA